MIFIASLFALGTLWFWLTLLVVSSIIIAFDYHENEGKAFATLLLFVGALIYFNPNFAAAVRNNPLYLLVGLALYVLAGVATAYAKFYFFLLNVRDANEENPPKFERRRNPAFTRHQLDAVPEYIEDGTTTIRVRGREVEFPIKVKNYAKRIVGWMMYWPWVALWTLLDEPVRRMFHRIYVACQNSLQRMADHITGNPPKTEKTVEIQPDEPWSRV
jgi:hypothetical protein